MSNNKDPQLTSQLLPNKNEASPGSAQSLPTPQDDYDYKQFSAEPPINFSKLTLILLCPALLILYLLIAKYFTIPLIQYSFVSTLTAFLINYTYIIRKNQLMPYLPLQAFDNKLKILCLGSMVSIIMSMYIGWNGSGGIIFAIVWQATRGSKMQLYLIFYACIIVGSILMENNYSVSKLWEFIPGMIFGYVNSQLFILRSSNPYTIAHQFTFLCAIAFPVFFPASTLISPSILQWVIMIGAGVILLVTLVLTVKLMQTARVSVVMGVLSGLMMVGTAQYIGMQDWVGLGLIGVGIMFLLKKQFVDQEY